MSSLDVAIEEAVTASLRNHLPVLLREALAGSVKTADGDELITTTQLAEETNTAVITWNIMRMEGRGPKFVKIGRSVRYRRSDIQSYLSSNVVGRRGRPPAMEAQTTESYHGRGQRHAVKMMGVRV